MELKLAVLFGLCCLLYIQIVESIILPNADANKFDGLKKDFPVASGASPDDEDGDVDEGSGSNEDHLEGSGIVKGNSNSNSDENIIISNSNNITVVTSPPLQTITTPIVNQVVETGNKKPSEKLPPRRPVDSDYGGKDFGNDNQDEDHDLSESDSRLDEDQVLIEDSSTARTVPAFKPMPTIHTTPLATPLPPSTADNRIYFGALFKPGILAAVIGGFVVGILAAILLVMFIVYRMRKKDEGSYALDEQKQPPMYPYAYQKASTKEFYA